MINAALASALRFCSRRVAWWGRVFRERAWTLQGRSLTLGMHCICRTDYRLVSLLLTHEPGRPGPAPVAYSARGRVTQSSGVPMISFGLMPGDEIEMGIRHAILERAI